MVPADSQQISRARCYLGTQIAPPQGFQVRDSHPLRPTLPSRSPNPRSISARSVRTGTSCPTTPHTQPLPGITRIRFSLIRFRSPLLTESLLLSLPVGTEMFHFPTFPLPALYIQAGVTRYARALAGFPHSDTLGSKLAYQFPEAYRRLLRPSSAPDAKASSVCS